MTKLKGRVVKGVASRFSVYTDEGFKTCLARGRLKSDGLIYVGDYVEIVRDRDVWVIESVAPRKNALIRPYVSNIDLCLITVAPVPAPDFLLVDKVIVNCLAEGITPVLVVNKSDIEKVDVSEYNCVETVYCSAETEGGADVLVPVIGGKTVCFAGQSAVGKSSLIKTLYAEVPLIEGEGRIVGFDLRNMKRRDISRLRRSIGIVFQDYQLLSDRDVFDNLHYVMKATGWNDENEMRRRIEEVLTVVGLENKAFKMPFELSGGQQQRLAVARALVNKPKVILADEPTGNLDPWAAEDIMEVFRRIVGGGCSVVMSTHNIANIEQFPSRTIRFNKGRTEEIDINSILGA